jgi:NAD+ synthase (glutamine-hydrolysing)
VAQIRVALAQVNPTVGAIDANAELIAHFARHAAGRGAQLIAFPEMVLTGYPVEDLALRGSFVAASRRALSALAGRLADDGLGEVAVVVGYLDRDEDIAHTEKLGRPKGAPQNALAVLHGGRIVLTQAKHHLPNYGVFDEFRHFVQGDHLSVLRMHGVDIAFAICEDLWQEGGPVATTRATDASLLVVINASPYELNKDDVRLDLCRRRAAQAGCTLAYVAMVGGQDELVFDGDSVVVGADGTVLGRAPQFEDGCLVVDLDLPEATAPAPPVGETTSEDIAGYHVRRFTISTDPLPAYEPQEAGITQRLSDDAEVYAGLVIGLRDYVRKNGFRSVVLGLSGGIDSALTAVVACDAIGPENVYAVSMPSRYSTDHSRSDARDLADRTGVNFSTVPISPMVGAFLDNVTLTGVAEENLQARIRGMLLMGLSNQHGHLVLATGNKSELAVGYSTIYGDAVGGYAPLKDVPKTMVWDLARWRNQIADKRGETTPIPTGSIEKPPSAELRHSQLDTDSLPDYHLLDKILDMYVEQDRGSADIVASGYDAELVQRIIRMVDAAEYKRRQYPPGPKVTERNFGRDRRVPITSGWREPLPPA